MKIVVIGTGYVGLVSGACFAEFGFHVTCVDNDSQKIERLKNIDIPIYEPGLDDLVRRNVAATRLSFTTNMADHIADADAIFIAVGTPARRGDGHADLVHILSAAKELAAYLSGYTVVVLKSTVPVGTSKQVTDYITDINPKADFDLVSNPEFLREGSALNDFMRPDRVIVGTNSKRAETVMRTLYAPLYLIETPVLFTSHKSAELIKYASNAFLAVKISYINQMADLCEAVGGDIHDVAKGMGLDKRIGAKFLHAGPGYGGSCFPKDTMALIRTAEQAKSDISPVQAALEFNRDRKAVLSRLVMGW